MTKNIAKIAASAMGISEKYLKNCINEYPDGYFVWEPISKGKTAFVDKEGNTLVADGGTPFKELYNAFRKGKRGRLYYLPSINNEIDKLFSVEGDSNGI